MLQFQMILVVVTLSGCLPNTDQPPQTILVPPTCGNGQCEPVDQESCINCPGDCPCCYAGIAATGLKQDQVKDPPWALGRPDGQQAQLLEGGSLELTFWRDIVDGVDELNPQKTKPDFEIIGQVTSSLPPQVEGCPAVAQDNGAVLVQVWMDDTWSLVGLWTGGQGSSNAFDLACANTSQTLQIRLEARPGATAQIDAIHALVCAE